MRILGLDFETYYHSKEYTLKKMTTEAYVRDPRFSAHGASIRWDRTGTCTWYPDEILREVLQDIDWSDTGLVVHHAQFDGLILSHHYNVRPKFWFCTLSMARLLYGYLPNGLDALAKLFGLEGKNIPYHLFDMYYWNELPIDVRETIAEGCCHDTNLAYELFTRMLQGIGPHGRRVDPFPRGELELIDMTVRMFTEPVLIGDGPLLAEIWTDEETKKRDLKATLGVTDAQLQSADQFKALLETEGVEIVYKEGKAKEDGTPRYIPAFAKTDEFMRELVDDPDERISGLAAARLGIKSTAIQSRAETLGWMAQRGALCIYLYYCGATATTRWSGGDDANFQNLKRGHRIRNALRASVGHYFGCPDASQIECRFLNFIAGQWDVIERFRSGADPYVGIASQFYGRQITKNDPDERGTGKQAELSCGYMCGPPRFKATARLGIYGPPVHLTDEEAARFVTLYRATHPAVTDLWREADVILTYLAQGVETTWRDIFHIKGKKIIGPTGVPISYETLHIDDETGEWRIKNKRGYQKMYGGKLVENVIQYIARIHIGDCMKVIAREGIRIVGMSHDELWALIEKGEGAEDDLKFMLDVISSPPPWMPTIPLAAEAPPLGDYYAK